MLATHQQKGSKAVHSFHHATIMIGFMSTFILAEVFIPENEILCDLLVVPLCFKVPFAADGSLSPAAEEVGRIFSSGFGALFPMQGANMIFSKPMKGASNRSDITKEKAKVRTSVPMNQ